MLGKSAKNTGIDYSLFGSQLNLSRGEREILKEISNGRPANIPGYFLPLSSDSVSAMEMLARVPGKGSIIAHLFKHLSPVTLTKILREVPISGRANFYERDFAYILTNVVAGEEKSRKEFSKGQVAFMPSGSSICFFLQNIRSYKPMNPLGEITQGMEVLESLRRGDSISIESITQLGTRG